MLHRRRHGRGAAVIGWLYALSYVCVLSAGASGDTASDENSAKGLNEKSVIAYRAGNFQEAVRLLREAYRLQPSPNLQYNLARALEGLGSFAEAAVAYRLYLKDAPANVTNRATVARRLEGLERQLAQEAELRRVATEREQETKAALEQAAQEQDARKRAEAEAAQRPVVDAPPPPQSRARRAAPWIVAGSGVATLVVGGALGGGALHDRNSAAANPTDLGAHREFSTAQSFSLGANVCFGVGGVIAGAGLVWGIVEAMRHRRQASAAQVQW